MSRPGWLAFRNNETNETTIFPPFGGDSLSLPTETMEKETRRDHEEKEIAGNACPRRGRSIGWIDRGAWNALS